MEKVTDNGFPRLISRKDLAALLGVTVNWLKLKHNPPIPSYKMRHTIRYDPDEVKIWLKTQRRA